MSAKKILSTGKALSPTTTIRVSQSTKGKLETLDFVRKNTFDEILLKLIEVYEKNKKGAGNETI